MIKTLELRLGGYTIFQAANRSQTQMMSYMIASPDGKLMVIDGGTREDVDYLRRAILKRGGVVDLWVITHCHYDHFEALSSILVEPRGIVIKTLMWNFPPKEWLLDIEPWFTEQTNVFFSAFAPYTSQIVTPREGETFRFEGINIDILKVPDDYASYDPGETDASTINDTSIVLKLTFPNGKTALFLGDLGFRAGEKLAAKVGDALKSDIVQMAHHGQNGAGENLYRLVRPELCLWCAPLWLYNNDLGGGFNSTLR